MRNVSEKFVEKNSFRFKTSLRLIFIEILYLQDRKAIWIQIEILIDKGLIDKEKVIKIRIDFLNPTG